MCYGSIDPKYGMRDLEARVKHLSRTPVPEKEAAPERQGGLIAFARAVLDRIRRKEVRHV